MANQGVLGTALTQLLIAWLCLVCGLPLAAAASKESSQGTPAQNWDQNLPKNSRFTLLSAFGGAAVRDNNTGLVWEQAPAATIAVFQDSTYGCANRTIGGQKGWRLPAIIELASLIDSSVVGQGPTLPAGHPFTNVQSALYWSATTHAVTPTTAWIVNFGTGILGSDNKSTGNNLAWCVRGPMNADTY